MSDTDRLVGGTPPGTGPAWLLAPLRQALGHELPNQLVAAQGLLRLLEFEEGGRLSTDGQDYVRRLAATVERCHALVLALAEIVQAARPTELPQVIPLAGLAQEVAAEVKKTTAGRQAEFAFDILVATVAAPPRAFRRALLEVMRQATRWTACDRPAVRIMAGEIAGGVAIRVADNGGGLSPEQIRQVFEPFAEGATDHRLGLVLARALVEGWGGSMEVHAEPGRGNTFTMVVPRPAAGPLAQE